jgi:hypothetical protein
MAAAEVTSAVLHSASMTGPTLRQTAVAAWDRGLTVTLVSIRRIGVSHGRSQHAPACDCSIALEREREAIVAMAGWAAEIAPGEVSSGVAYDSNDLSQILSGIDEYAPSHVAIELGWAQSGATDHCGKSRAGRAIGERTA